MPKNLRKWQKGILLLLGLFLLSSCSSIGYYWQAASGHIAIMNKVEPVSDILAQPELDKQLRSKLELAVQARDFASRELLLPDNQSYRGYADLGRPYVVWNVVATPEFSVQPQQWCFLFVGCLSYRGYFNKADALAMAEELRGQGMDTFVGGVSAYSTIGYFDDPLLNTMLRRDEADLVGVIFHELAHQLIYIQDDTAFNEAFASAVQQEGVRRWFIAQAQPQRYAEVVKELQQRHEVIQMLQQGRTELQKLYAHVMPDETRRNLKRQIFGKLKQEYQQWRIHHEFSQYDHMMGKEMNNADLAIIATYFDIVPAFMHLLLQQQNDLAAFYQEVRTIGAMPKDQRHARLQEIIQNNAGTAAINLH